MIEWMQTHRKWLVITIWIATIAFIGAGFVGWGQFNLTSKSSTVAEINGNTEVSIQDVQDIYNNLFADLNQKMGGKLDDATAEKLGLKQQAFQMAIAQGLLREYAKNLGLYVTDKEVAEAIIETFKDTKTYKQYLKMNGLKAKEFEDNLRKKLLVSKLLQALHLKPSNTEVLTTGSALYNADDIAIKVFNKDDVKVDISEDELKKYWEENKENYESKKAYKIEIVKTPLKGDVTEDELKNYYNENKNSYKNEKGEIKPFEDVKDEVKRDLLAQLSKRKAIIEYKKLKEGKEKNYEIITVELNNDIIPQNKMEELIQNGYLKPFLNKNSYVSAVLIEEINPKPLPFEKAKNLVLRDLLNKKVKEALIQKAEASLKNFDGKDIGFVTKYDINKIKGLQPDEAVEFLFKLFSSTKPKGFFLIPSSNPQKAVVYEIKAQKLLDKKEFNKNRAQVETLTETLINSEVINDLIKELMQKYHIKSYVKE